jgi:hypothetical protein
MKTLPIGTQSFEVLRSSGFLYVDKTENIHRLITNSRVVFLSRPRRFGKSLLISTLEELFKGNKSLFEGLYIYDKWDWTQQYPVIRIDWTSIKHGNKEEMENDMSDFLHSIATANGITLTRRYATSLFAELIELLHHKISKKVVVLIDEYDSPILDAMGNSDFRQTQQWLQDFYKILKAADDHLKFVFLTGITKVAKVSIFSVLNSTNDITIDDRYASICGYTQEELECNFAEHINDVAAHSGKTKDDLLVDIRTLYDGYTWDGKTAVYNPFSTLMFFDKKVFSNYWFETGTPAFLIERLKKQNLSETVLEPVTVGSSAFESYDPENLENIPLLFQTGYLTIKSVNQFGVQPAYTLGIPNMEVKESLMNHLLSVYTRYPLAQMGILARNMLQQILNFDAEGLNNNLRIMLSGVPYTLHPEDKETEDANEARYHIIFHIWMTLLGFDIQSEKLTNRGRMDAVLKLPGLAIVAELKYHATTKLDTLLDNAIAQIHGKRYYEQFLDRKVVLLGIAFSGKEVGCRIEPLENLPV